MIHDLLLRDANHNVAQTQNSTTDKIEQSNVEWECRNGGHGHEVVAFNTSSNEVPLKCQN